MVRLTSFESAFPVCEECWKTASTEQIVAAARKLGDIWIHSSNLCVEQLRKTRCKASRMVKAVEKAAKKRCDFCPIGPQRKGILRAACVGCRREEIEKDADPHVPDVDSEVLIIEKDGFKEQIRKRAEQSKGLKEAGP